MKFKASFVNYNVLNNGNAKIPLMVTAEEYKDIEAMMSNFRGRDLIIEMNVDARAEAEKLNMITEQQRKKIYALIADIAEHTDGITRADKIHLEEYKTTRKREFIGLNPGLQMFSLSNCNSETARDFIEYLLMFAMEHDVPLSEGYGDFEKSDAYFYFCIKNKKCAVCQGEAEIHHIEAIGMGRDRKQYDDSQNDKIALCRKHHNEAHSIGWEEFSKKYLVKGVK